MIIRAPKNDDFEEVYALGKSTPELRVSATEEFMDRDEFSLAIQSPASVFFVAEVEGAIGGFIYANADDKDKPLLKKWACLVYLAVAPELRNHGVGTQLYDACVAELKGRGVTHLYGWANTESDGAILSFMQKNGFTAGHMYRWMDREI